MVRPVRFADEPRMEYDEDNVGREDAGDAAEERDDLDWMYLALRDGDASVARGAVALARCFQEMAVAAQRGHEPALQHWYRQCRHVLNNIAREGMEGEQ
jgi:hypothetical protein